MAYEVTATGDFGVTTGAATASFPANGATVQVSVATTGDGVHEAHGTVTVTLTADTGADPAYLLGDPATATAAVEDDDDSPTTGVVTITGTPTEGETLGADTSGLTDADGLDNAAWAYQWVRTPAGGSDADISGATDATYVPVFADAGATLKVRVTVTDDEGHQATFTSAPAAVAALPRPEVTVVSDGDVTEGSAAVFTLTRTGDTAQTLDVDYEVTASGNFGVTPFEATFTFLAGNATVQVSVPTTGDGAHEAHGSVTVTLTADTSADPAYLLGDPATATAAIRDDDNAAPTGAPTIDDTTPVVGQTLTADASGIGDADGLTGATFIYRWLRVASGGAETEVGTGASYTVVAGDLGATLKVAASFTDDGGTAETVESAATSAVAAAPRPRVSVERVSSPVQEGEDVQFRVTRTGVTAGALTVRYRVSESGAMVASGEEGAKTIAFGDGDTEQTVTVPTVEDTSHEADSTVTLTLTPDAAYDLGTASAAVTVEDDDNAAPTGAPTIDDTTPVVGQTLTADASGIGDADGLTGATFTWRWLRVAAGGAETEVGTGATYTVVAGDLGSTLKVAASFTDDDGTAETVESAETATVAAAPALPVVTVASDGDVTEGSPALFTLMRTGDPAATLEVAYEVTATGDFGVTTGAATASFPANGATVQVSVATTGDATHEAHGSVTVTLTADTGADPAYLLGDPATATATVADDDDSPTTGVVTITGTPTEGETLGADTSGLTDADGLDNAGYVYQWVRTPSGGSDADISGATDATYVPVFADVGATLKVRVTVTDDEGHQATFTSAPTAAVAALPRPEVTVVSDGDVTEGSPALFTLTRTGDPAETLDVAYEVTATGDFGVTTGAGTASFPANGATVQVSVATTGDATHEAHGSVTVTLTADTGADPAYLLGDPATATAAVEDDDDSPTTGVVTITGTPTEGETLGADTSGLTDADGLDDAGYVYQWVRTPSGGSDADISGATDATYVPVFADVGATLKVRVTVTDDEGHQATFTSAPTAAVAALPRPVVTVVSDGDVTEGSPALFTLTRTGDPAETLDVAYEVTATGVFGVTTGAGTASFPANGATVQVSVATTGDGVHEAHGTVTVTLTADTSADPAYLLGAPATATAAVEDDDNAAPTGAPTIDDTTPVAGETLTADPSGIGDPDGLTGATFTWQWVRVSGGTETPIAGATTASYTVAAADVGATLKVAASFTDDGGTAETVESAATATVALPMLSIGDASVDEGDSGSVTLNFTVTLSHAATETVAVEWATADGTATAGTDYTAGSGRLTFNTGDSSRTVFVTVASDDVDEPDETFTVTLSNPSGATIEDGAATGTIRDNDDEPKVTLIVAPNPLHENGGTSTVTASLDRASSAATTVTVSVTPVAPTVEDNYEVSDNLELTIAAGATTSTGTVTITGVNNREHSPNKEISVSGTAANSRGVTDPDPVTLPILDDDGPPSVTLHLTPDAITENGGLSTVTARQSRRSGADTTVTVSAAPVSPAVAGDYTLSADLVLTVVAGETESTGTVTVTAVNNSVYEGDKQVTVSGTAENELGILGNPQDVTLTITDDEDPPPELSIGDASVTEGDTGSTTMTFTVTLNRTATETVTVDWATADGTATAGTDYTAGNGTLTFNIGDSSKTVSVTVAGDNVDERNETFTVTLSNASSGATIGDGVATGTITDDDATPRVTLLLSPDTIDEAGGTSTVTASLDRPSSEDTTVQGIGGANVEAFYTVGPGPNPVLTIAAGETASTGTVTITAVANNVDAPDKRITVSAEASNSLGVTFPDDVTLTIRDDDDPPTVTLHLSPDTISEAGGESTATASLSRPSGVDTTVTVTVVPVSPAEAGDYRLSSNVELTIVAGAMASTGTVTITAVDNDVDAPDKEVTVWATTTNAHSGSVLDDAPLTIEDDEGQPTVRLHLAPDTIGENGGTSTVTASLDRPSSEATTVTVTAAPESPATAADYTLSGSRLTIAAGQTTSTGTVTITAVDNDLPERDKEVTVSGTAANSQGITDPNAVTLTIEDDEAPPELSIGDASVTEGDTGSATMTFTVSLDRTTTGTVTVNWATADGTATAGTDYTAGTGSLTFDAGEISRTVRVTVTDDDVDEPDETFRVRLSEPSGATIEDGTGTGTIRDDDEAPTVTLVLDQNPVTEAGGESTVTASLDHPSSAATTVTVTAAPVLPAEAGDYRLSENRVLTIAAGARASTGLVTITAVDNDVDAPDKTVTVSGTAANAQGVTAPGDVPLTIADDDEAPTVTLVLDPASVTEAGGESTVTASLDRASSEDTTVTVAAAPVLPAEAGDYRLSENRVLTIAAGARASTGLVTITAVDNDVDAPDKTVTVSGTAANAQGVTAPGDVPLTVEDDDEAPTVTLVLDPALITEAGGESTVTATLDRASSEDTTVTVTAAPVLPAEAGDYRLSENRVLTIAAGATTSTGLVTITAVDNDVDAPDKTVTVSGTAANTQGVTAPGDVTLTVEDDDEAPTVTLVLDPGTITEAGGESTVTATLDHPSSEATVVTVSAAPVSPAVTGDYRLSENRVLRIAAGTTTSTGVVTITAVDNDVKALDKQVTVSGTATNDWGITAPQDVTLTIADDDLINARHRRLEYALASFGRTVVQDLVTAIEDREWSASAGTTATIAGTRLPPGSFQPEEAISRALQRHAGADGAGEGTAALRELLFRSNFRLSLGNEDDGEAGGWGAGSLMLWGRGSQSWSKGRLDPAVATEGEVLSGQLGVELRVRKDTLVGVMLNGSDGELDFDEELETEVEANVISVHPYAQWSPRHGLRAWAMLGYGLGEAALSDSFSALTETDIETDIGMVMAAAGGSNEVASLWGIDWSLGTNGFLVQLDADEREGLLPAVESEVWQVRLLLEGSAGKELGGGSGLTGNVELAVRVDGGDAEAGLGMELGGGVAYGHPDLGIEVEASGRILLSHQEEGLEDAGVSLSLGADPGEPGRGLYFALAPSWGNAASGARAMWEDRQASTGVAHGSDGRLFDPKMRLDSELGYTTPLPTRRGTLTSYGAFSSDGGTTGYRLGRRLELTHGLSMSLEAERRKSAGAAPEHGIWLKGSIRY